MRMILLRGLSALTLTGSLAILMTVSHPIPAQAQGSGSGSGSMGLFCKGNPTIPTCAGPCLFGGPCAPRINGGLKCLC